MVPGSVKAPPKKNTPRQQVPMQLDDLSYPQLMDMFKSIIS